MQFYKEDLLMDVIERKKHSFRTYRRTIFQAFDLWEKAVLRGREEDSEDIMNWYQAMLDFPEQITEATTYQDYPKLPERIKHYL